jgi:predicted component of type VI protein secretion system
MAATAAPRTNAILKLKAAGRTRLIVFDTQDLSLGRAKENDLAVDDPEMSRRHAVFKRSREGCAVEDMGTSNGTAVNGQTVQRAVLKHGDVVKIGEVEITYAETSRSPSSLGPVEYASQLKAFGTPMARVKGDGEATILGMLDAPTSDGEDDDFEIRPAGEFDFDLQSQAKARSAPRDLDAEIASLDVDSDFTFGSAPTQSPARPLKPAPQAPRPAAARVPVPARKPAAPALSASQDVWELDENPAHPKPAAGPLSVTLEIDGLSGELRSAVEALLGKVIELPSLRVKIKGRDLA